MSWIEQQVREFDGSPWAVVHQEHGGACPYSPCPLLETHQHPLNARTGQIYPITEPYVEPAKA